jgi:hypothetical protein
MFFMIFCGNAFIFSIMIVTDNGCSHRKGWSLAGDRHI